MTDNQFDNFFREKLRDHTAPVPDGLWEKIHPEKEKRPKGFFLPKINGTGLMVAALLVGTVIVGLLTYQHQSSVPAEASALSQSKKQTNSSNKSNSNSTLNNSTLNNTTSVNNSTLNPVPNNTVITIDSTIEIVEDPAIHFVKNTAAAETPIPFVSRENSTDDINYVNAHIDQQSLFFNPESAFSITGKVNKNLAANGHDKFIKSNIIICPTIRGRSSINSDWGFELFVSPDYSFKTVSNVTASQDYLNKKDSSEQMQIGYSAGFRLVKPLNDRLSLKAGFQYSQMNQKFTYRNENEIKTTTVITTRSIIRSPGDTVLVSDTSTLQQIGYSVKTINNHYRSIDIPLTVGYQFGNDDLSVGINAGVIFNVSSWYQGEILDTSLASVPISKVSNSIYKSNIGMGLYSSISVLKRINENTQLFFEPYFRYNLSNMTNSQSPYNQKFHVGGLAIGLRFSLNK
ncbi:MAG: hypothetical protein WCH78_11245 [Bacteroidota bacterium]